MDQVEEIAARLGVRAERGKRFADLTSLRVGGAIDWVITPQTEAEAAAIVYEMDQAGIEATVANASEEVIKAIGADGIRKIAEETPRHYPRHARLGNRIMQNFVQFLKVY